MPRTTPVLVAVAVGLLAGWRSRRRLTSAVRRRREALPEGVQEYRPVLVDHRRAADDALPPRPETATETTGAFYAERGDAAD